MAVTIGRVETFPDAKPDKAQVLKVLEECAEVFSAWEDLNAWRREADEGIATHIVGWRRNNLIYECADLIQATCNLLAGISVDDMTEAMERCRIRNVERGRM